MGINWDKAIFTLTVKNKKGKLLSVQPLNLRLLDESYKVMKIQFYISKIYILSVMSIFHQFYAVDFFSNFCPVQYLSSVQNQSFH